MNKNKNKDNKLNINEDNLNNLSFYDKNKINNTNNNNASQKHPSSKIMKNNIEDVNKEELQKVKNELDKIYQKNKNNNSKKDEPQFEGYEQKTNNGCNCNLDCLEWCKQLF